jgi:hypothetical protein
MELSMKSKDVARKILTLAFPEECQAIGPDSLDHVISGDVKIVMPEEGRPFPIVEILDFLKEASQFILSAYAVYKIVKEQGGGRKPTVTELKKAVAKEESKPVSLSHDQIERILKEIVKL